MFFVLAQGSYAHTHIQKYPPPPRTNNGTIRYTHGEGFSLRNILCLDHHHHHRARMCVRHFIFSHYDLAHARMYYFKDFHFVYVRF